MCSSDLCANALEAIAGAQRGDGVVTIAAARSQAGDCLEIAVRDNGPGVPDAVRGRLFDALVTTRPDGLGLGLAICATIVESHNGRLWLESSRPGHTEFRFRIPFAAGDGSA